MTIALLTPAAQICAFALGCALIHAARQHAATVTRVLIVTVAAVIVLILLSFPHTPTSDGGVDADGITISNAA